jgi:DnaJ-domain-containing protein 1
MRRKPFTDFLPSLPESGDRPKRCDSPGCEEPGEYRAPRVRNDLDSYYLFCLEHVREYNAAWNYCSGMNEDEIEHQIRADVTWRRPTWPFGAGSGFANRARRKFSLGAFAADNWTEAGWTGAEERKGHRPRPGSPQERALAVLDLNSPVTQEAIKARYKNLVKRHHPDANGGDKEAEERLKIINQAYSTLKDGVLL